MHLLFFSGSSPMTYLILQRRCFYCDSHLLRPCAAAYFVFFLVAFLICIVLLVGWFDLIPRFG